LMGTELQCGDVEGSGKRRWRQLHSHGNVLITSELCALRNY
jgi:hypothetical protein